eukprot:TRINITY_DN44867_c0_g1_i1.p1 TRINITY_DN44867_c0_g1~~TRINITY_DN44867_c0_g1_i1.p1  ORF type:complete len:544 (+),score=116.14 TRINITY_DN44867_c0_g1_i1:200-1831(+)
MAHSIQVGSSAPTSSTTALLAAPPHPFNQAVAQHGFVHTCPVPPDNIEDPDLCQAFVVAPILLANAAVLPQTSVVRAVADVTAGAAVPSRHKAAAGAHVDTTRRAASAPVLVGPFSFAPTTEVVLDVPSSGTSPVARCVSALTSALVARRSPTACTLQLALGFLFLYMALGTLKNFITTLFQDLGHYALALLYVSFSLGSLVTPSLLRRAGTRRCLAIGGAGYALFVGSVILGHPVVVCVAAALAGFSASAVWNAQAMYLNAVVPATDVGHYVGLFYAVYNLNGVFGNLVMGGLLAAEVKVQSAVSVLLGVAVAGATTLAFLPTSGIPRVRAIALVPNLVAVARTACTGRFASLMLAMLAQGCATAVVAGVLPRYIASTPDLTYRLGFTYAAYSLAGFIFSLVGGALLRVLTWRAFVLATPVAYGGFFALAWFGVDNALASEAQMSALWIGALCAYAIFESCLNTLVAACVYGGFQESLAAAFAAYRSLSALAQAIGFMYASAIPVKILLGAFGGAATVGCVLAGVYAQWRGLTAVGAGAGGH